MTTKDNATRHHPLHGEIGYLQLPALDIGRSAGFYAALFGWNTDPSHAGFEAPGLIGQWTTDRVPSTTTGPLIWICVEDIARTLRSVPEQGGTVHAPPSKDEGERWLAEIIDPAGNLIGIVAALRPVTPQPLVVVRDVEAASAWYQQLLGVQSDHGGTEYERLTSQGALVLQLHRWDVEHDHGPIGDPPDQTGNGNLLWFVVDDFDEAVERAAGLGARIVLPPHRNPPEGPGGPAHREIWLRDLDGYTVVLASPDGESP